MSEPHARTPTPHQLKRWQKPADARAEHHARANEVLAGWILAAAPESRSVEIKIK